MRHKAGAYEIYGADAKCLVCFTTEVEAAEELIILQKNIPNARLVHFHPKPVESDLA
ncbi:hypothetical protein J2W69_001128 [Rheinheimera soli]|jgi:hypothetical protein|uniref:DUF3303 domain-containing protein n=1 Tax=Rheinheimera soli TaxID=443616 RepID=A0ABU1VWT8_9GAMM|nr:hypothetical protein [Rheinheimera soli]